VVVGGRPAWPWPGTWPGWPWGKPLPVGHACRRSLPSAQRWPPPLSPYDSTVPPGPPGSLVVSAGQPSQASASAFRGHWHPPGIRRVPLCVIYEGRVSVKAWSAPGCWQVLVAADHLVVAWTSHLFGRDRPWCGAAGAAQSSRRPLHSKAMTHTHTHTHTERARATLPATTSRGGVGTTAILVAQGVGAQGEQPPGQCHPGDLGPAALGDLLGEAAEVGVADGGGGRLDQHPAQPAGALLGGCGRGGCGRRWCVPQGSARPRSTTAPVRGTGRPPRPRRRRWPRSPARCRDRQQASDARVAGELGAQVRVGVGDLDGDGVDQPQAGI
jgi:hypothetical protein